MSNSSGFLHNKEVCKMLGISRTTLWQLVKTDNSFPKPIEITPRNKVFKLSDFEKYFNKKSNQEV